MDAADGQGAIRGISKMDINSHCCKNRQGMPPQGALPGLLALDRWLLNKDLPGPYFS
jgi:hypothetical protein